MLNPHYILLITLVSTFVVDVSIACFKSTSMKTPNLRAGVATFIGPFQGGQVVFTPTADRKLKVTGQITGLPPKDRFFVNIHSRGNLGDECRDAGEHWNPFDKNHGDLISEVRHEGDLGNRATDDTGSMSLNLTLTPDERDPTHGYIGLALVVRLEAVEVVLSQNERSIATNNFGPRWRCAVIGLQ